MPRLGASHLRMYHSIHWHVQGLGLRAGLIGKLRYSLCWATVSTYECDCLDWGQADLDKAAVPYISYLLDWVWG